MDPSWTLENYHVNATTNVDVLYQTPTSGSHHHHHHHHRQLPTFHKILNNNNGNKSKSNTPMPGYHQKYPQSNGTGEDVGMFWNPEPSMIQNHQAKPEFGPRFSDNDAILDCDYYQPNRPFRQRSSLNNVDQYYHDQLLRKNPRRHSSTTSSILDVPSSSSVHGGGNFHRDCSPSHRRGSSIFVQPPQPSTAAMIDTDPVMVDDQRTRNQRNFVSNTGSNSNNNNSNQSGNLARHSPLHQQQSLGLAAAAAVTSSSSSSSSSSMIMAPFSTQAENRAFHHHQLQHHNNHNHNLHHLQQQQLQFGSLHPSTSMYSSSTSSLQTTSSSSQTAPGTTGGGGNGLGSSSSSAVAILGHSPRNGFNGYCSGNGLMDRRQSSSMLIDECTNSVLSNDNFDADNDGDGDDGGGGEESSSSFHLRVNSPDVGEDDDRIVQSSNHPPMTKTNNNHNKNQNDDDHNHLHVPNHYINCDDDLLEVDEDFHQNHRSVRRHRSLPAPTFSMSASSSMNSVKQHPRSSSFRIRTNRAQQSATRIQEPNGYWRIRVKKSKPYLGIAIEGGSNVSAQSQPRIINIQEDGAANVEGLHVGHIIMEVDGKTTNFMNHGQVAQMIARAYYNTPEKDYVEFLVREKSRNEFDLRRSSFMLLNSSYE